MTDECVTAIAIRDTVTGRVWIGGVIHYDLFAQAVSEIGPVMLDRLMPGFVTSRLRFVDYATAARIDPPRIKHRLTPPAAQLTLSTDECEAEIVS